MAKHKRSLILLIEDDPDYTLLLQRAFRHTVPVPRLQIVRDASTALKYLAGQGAYADRDRYPLPELVLLDMNLPGGSALELLKSVRQRPGLKRLPVVALTSAGTRADINSAYDAGVNSYLLKPETVDVLLNLVKAVAGYWLILNQKPDIR